MSDERRFRFHIDAYSPADIPMAKLAEYMADFAELLGKEHRVHFDRLEDGSTTIVSRVEREDVPKVDHRLRAVVQGTAEKELLSLMARIDERLANDNATGRVLEEIDGQSAEVIVFPGRDRPKMPTYGPFVQEGHLDGVLISVGGKDETISIRLQNGAVIYRKCETTRTIARELGQASVRAGAHPRRRPLAARRAGRLAPGPFPRQPVRGARGRLPARGGDGAARGARQRLEGDRRPARRARRPAGRPGRAA